jgi:hypothetical protein
VHEPFSAPTCAPPRARRSGKIEDVVLDKLSNNIMYAVVGFGGFLGAGEKHHPLPWSTFDYDPSKSAYVIPYDKDQLKAAPAASIEELTGNDGRAWRDQSYDHWKTPRDW